MRINNYFTDNFDVILELDFKEDIEFDDRETDDEARRCRFCGCLEDEYHTFKKKAHAIPELLGNKTIITQNECDKCNHYFGTTLETELGNYFSIWKPLFRIPSKKSTTKFKQTSEDDINEVQFDKKKNHITITSTIGSDRVQINTEEKTLRFKLTGYSYTPFRVYQAFIRLFISVLPKEHLEDADFAKIILNFDILNNYSEKGAEILKQVILCQAKAILLFIPNYPVSQIVILKKKREEFVAPDFIFILRVANIAFQICIQKLTNRLTKIEVPSIFNDFINEVNDMNTNSSKEINLPKQWIEDFSSLEKMKPKDSTMTFGFTDFQELNIESKQA